MKAGHLLIFLGILSFAAGCDRSSETDTSSSSSERRASLQDRDTNVLPSTSRNASDANRKYADDTNAAAAKPADNTGKNVRDRSDAALTPGDQGNSESDREITRRIRREINQNDQLSTMAKNIKIITADGKVTLRGPVANDQELKAISDVAQTVAGPSEIDNQLEIKTTNQ